VKPYFEDAYTTLYQDDALNVLAQLEHESVQVCVTSPPYWGLRKYSGEQERIWGGDPDCPNHWGLESGNAQGETYVGKRRWQHEGVSRQETPEEWVQQGGAAYKDGKVRWQHQESNPDAYKVWDENKTGINQSATCARCGAWRGAFGLEPTVEMYVEHTVEFLRAIRRVLRADGVVFWNIGDSYAGSRKGMAGGNAYAGPNQATNPGSVGLPVQDWRGLKSKDLVLMPFRVALAAQGYVTVQAEQMWELAAYLDEAADIEDWEMVRLAANTLRVWAWGERLAKADNWWARSVIVWSKPNPMPESVTDRPTDAYEFILMLAKSGRYYWDQEAVREPMLKGASGSTFTEGKTGEMGFGRVSQQERADNGAARNLRNVWTFPTQPFGMEMCKACKQVYPAAEYGRLNAGKAPACVAESVEGEKCGSPITWLADDAHWVCESCGSVYTNAEAKRLPRVKTCHCGAEGWLSHFATFPEELVKQCVKAATSERGCCPQCGTPWVRVVEKPNPPKDALTNRRAPTDGLIKGVRQDGIMAGSGQKMWHWLEEHPSMTIGWQPSCSCDAGEPIPSTVLDPFTGSGTTNWVAKKMGRKSIGIELSEDYCRLAVERLRQGVLI
jgi:DNA modification methylase